MRILLVEDEPLLQQQLQEALKQEGYAVDTAQDGEEALFMGREYPYDLAIIDLGLPKIDGMAVIRSLREQQRDFPVLILTARSSWQDKVAGLESGADDYLAKPFHMPELMARLNALLRRRAGSASAVLSHGPLALDTNAKTVTVNEQGIELTAYEYKVLEYMLMNASKVVSKIELTEHIYDQDFDRDSNVIEVFVGRLRKKLDVDSDAKLIETVRGQGYRLATMPN